ncbi:hypothetical protein EI983_12690 [Roseovarius faecimaris]|uniref:Uncharacterized protein n=1 Tax=Roseovarius faecimaris TaxID=2494550 RepID=A0A6I6J2S7_9RHOB|nr:hypothetical protein EI983_12690 [Roseovarius faecimaris]
MRVEDEAQSCGLLTRVHFVNWLRTFGFDYFMGASHEIKAPHVRVQFPLEELRAYDCCPTNNRKGGPDRNMEKAQ